MADKTFDVVVIGGGVMGSSVAYHLLHHDPALAVAVVERDPTYATASSALSVGNVRVQFGLTENILISRYTHSVLEEFGQTMAVGGSPAEVGFHREANLFLVDREGEAAARQDLARQRELGCEVEWWSTEDVERRYPILDTSGLVGGTFSAGDGHLDGYAFLMAYLKRAKDLGAEVLSGEVVEILCRGGAVCGVRTRGGEVLASDRVVNCAGAWAAGVARSAAVELPVVPITRQVFVAEPAVKPEAPLPLVNLPSGLYFRSEPGDLLLVGKSMAHDPVGHELEWHRERFVDHLWPELAGLAPAFDRLRLVRGWAGLYAVNSFDGNAILGEWPHLGGLYLAAGFSGHGLQQAPAVGRYLAELILGADPALDLSCFGPQRILDDHPLGESWLV